MEPKPPDPITAAYNLQRIPNRVRTLSDSFRMANQKEKRLPNWREYQLLSFMKYVGLYASASARPMAPIVSTHSE